MSLKGIRSWHPIRALDSWWLRVTPKRRLDRSPANLCTLIGLMCPTLAIVLVGPVPNSALSEMPEYLQIWMCAFIFFGCATKFYGAMAGSKYFRPKMSVKQCYTYGFIGAPLASSGLFVYGYFILAFTPNFVAALSGILTPMLGLGIGLQALLYFLEYRRIDHAEEVLIDQAKAALGENDSDSMG